MCFVAERLRRNKRMCEERDGSGIVTKTFVTLGQTLSGNAYFYTQDHLGSVREMVDSAATTGTTYSYGMYGETSKLSGTLSTDFQYADYYFHDQSRLSLAVYRCYSPVSARWLRILFNLATRSHNLAGHS